jgi:hypothetical protein
LEAWKGRISGVLHLKPEEPHFDVFAGIERYALEHGNWDWRVEPFLRLVRQARGRTLAAPRVPAKSAASAASPVRPNPQWLADLKAGKFGFTKMRDPAAPYRLHARLHLSCRGPEERRCAECHKMAPGAQPGRKGAPLASSWMRRVRFTNPENNSFLLAPLAKAAGGTEKCGKAVFAGTNDPDYSSSKFR